MRQLIAIAFGLFMLSACGGSEPSLLANGEIVSLASAAQAIETTDEEDAGGLDGEASRARIERLKARIRAIARANQRRTDNLEEVAARLRPLVRRLNALAPVQTPEQQLALLEGPWLALWSNLGYGPVPPDLTRIFQVVTLRGHYYNLSQPAGGVPVINALRGAYAQIPEGLAIRFTRNGLLLGSLVGRTGAALSALAAEIERGAIPVLPIPGPIGITGRLTTLYVDDDFRVAGGDQTPVFDDNGVVSVPGQSGLLFILDRQVGPVR